ncbi:tripartite tricarboxylate transporter substrate binding protein [Aurantimonas sp. A2-1-M11]|uniref:Bug family tripartite tricarboxylate transporter substrate binding protein n=1 Tax=Aurantimonas sp. A2-1-M11 TaxID=3113712 RepID=UPI002F9428F0
MNKLGKSLAVLAALGMTTAAALAQDASVYPDRPVSLIIPYSPGGGTDILGRIVAQKLSEDWGQPVVVENRPGASGLVGAKAAMQAEPDGYTLVMGSTGTLMSVATDAGVGAGDEVDVNPILEPITMIAAPPYLLVVNPTLGVEDVEGLVAKAKEDSSSTRFGSSGVGSASHLTGELFNSMAGTEMLHVPYKGTGPAVTDLLSGEITVMFGPAPTLLPHVESGTLKALAVTTPKPSGLFPDYPTVDGAGVPGFASVGWFGLFAPPGTPAELIEKINTDVQAALTSDQVREQLAGQGAEPDPLPVAEFTDFVESDTAKWISLRDSVAN